MTSHKYLQFGGWLISGVFGNPNSALAASCQSMISSVENGDTFPIKESIEPPSGIYGKAVTQSIPSFVDVENEKDVRLFTNY